MTGTIRRTMTSTRNRLLQDENEYYGGNADGAKDSWIYAGKWHCRFGGVADNLQKAYDYFQKAARYRSRAAENALNSKIGYEVLR